MTKPMILSEMTRLQAYLKDRRLNLPEIIFEADSGVRVAEERLKELTPMLESAEQQEAKLSEETKRRREEANKRLHVYMDKLYFIREELETLNDPETRVKAAEMSNMIAQMLLNHKPQKKDK